MIMRKSLMKMVIRQLIVLLGSFLLAVKCLAVPEPVEIFVSILPQKFFVERIAGDKAKVEIMVGPGQSPETYEPSPKQLTKLSTADIYFSIGVPFETAWMSRMSDINNHLKIVDTAAKASVFYTENYLDHHGEQTIGNHTIEDPHIWVSPVLAKRIAESILETLLEIDPENAVVYQKNFQVLQSDLDDLDIEIRKTLGSWIGKGSFLVMHPAWGYFAKTYDLEQIAIEHEGKSPSAKSLHKLINRAKNEKIKVVFVQDQHSSRMAETVASAIGAKVVRLDPLAENYIENLRTVVAEIAGSFQQEK